MLEPIPFWGYVEVDLPVKTYAGDKANYVITDEQMNKAFEYYCETDEGVLRFNYELRNEWKQEQLMRWKEAFKKVFEK
jgi:hypothetical protein